jgi:hypothetical protein
MRWVYWSSITKTTFRTKERSHIARAGALSSVMEHASGFDRSRLHSDEGPPNGTVAAEPGPEAASALAVWLLRGAERG